MPEIVETDSNVRLVRFGEEDETYDAIDGAELFTFGPNSGDDVIRNFNESEDLISLLGADIESGDFSSEQTDEGLLLTWGDNSLLLEDFSGELGPTSLVGNSTGGDVDIIYGGSGNDVVIGDGSSTIIFTGNGGEDTVQISGNENVVFRDFNVSEDIVLFSDAGLSREDVTVNETDFGFTLTTGLGGEVSLFGVSDLNLPSSNLFDIW
ncbi:hypothetical protein [Kordiimonas laminariae]|uniref:hypothetical protein n=1 Tax=Kordiimonas laminariae TaxID=2917717 RepID=UPI001FF181FB|nr:hypothetical protein [Kordiimonas laminariae]MCK0070736.1 hypothetical protein [Kordiimonas laminariae]